MGTVRWTTLCLIRAFCFGHQSRGNTSAVPCFGGLDGALWPASDGEVFSEQSSANYFRLTTAGSACPRLSGRTCTLPDGGPDSIGDRWSPILSVLLLHIHADSDMAHPAFFRS
jgi:hypothetical protein